MLKCSKYWNMEAFCHQQGWRWRVATYNSVCWLINLSVFTIHHRSRPTRAASLISLRNSPRPLYMTQKCLYQKRKEEAAELVAEEFVISDLCQNRRRLSEIILIYSVLTHNFTSTIKSFIMHCFYEPSSFSFPAISLILSDWFSSQGSIVQCSQACPMPEEYL